MKFKINREHFSNGLSQLSNVVSTRSTMPILSNVLIVAKEGEISLTTTNLELGMRCKISAEVEEEGAITLPVRKLANIVRELPTDDVLVEVSKKNQAKITCGGSIFRIMGIDESEFPQLPVFEDQRSFTFNQTDLIDMLNSVSFAQSGDENRYILNGVYFNFEVDKISLVATDGRRLAMSHQEMSIDENQLGNLILPAKTVAELMRSLGKGDSVKISFNDRQVAFDITLEDGKTNNGMIDSLHLVSKIVDGNYPNFRQVIPNDVPHSVTVERELLADCVKRAALVVTDKHLSITLKLSKNLLEITGSSSEYGDAHESVQIDFDCPDDQVIRVAFNPQYLLDPLRSFVSNNITFDFKDELSPGIVRNDKGFLCVIMPLRLDPQ